MPWASPPDCNVELSSRFIWPSHLVGLSQDDLSGDLHRRFNTIPMFIQTMDAFHTDVSELAREARGQEDFYLRLETRRNQRSAELRNAVDKLVTSGGIWDVKAEYGPLLLQLMRTGTFDSLVQLLAALLELKDRTPSPVRSPSPYIARSEDGLTQGPYDYQGIGPEHNAQWEWETPVQRDERMLAEGKIVQRQSSSKNIVQPGSDAPTVDEYKAPQERITRPASPRLRDDHTRNSTAASSGGASENSRKRKPSQRHPRDAEMSRHEIRVEDNVAEMVEACNDRCQGRAKMTATRPRPTSGKITAMVASNGRQESQTASASVRVSARLAKKLKGDKKRKREIDDEQDQLDEQLNPGRRVKARITTSTANRKTKSTRVTPTRLRRSPRLAP